MIRVPALLAAAVLVAGCSSAATPVADGGPAAGAAGATPVPGSPAPCPPAAEARFPWPAGVPDDLPQPPGAVLTSSTPGADGLTVVRFTTSQSLREGVLYLVRALQPAGYTLGRGDAEAAEADAPFTKGSLRGIYRMVARAPCATDWLLAVAPETPGAAPLLPPSTGSAPPSPLPFG